MGENRADKEKISVGAERRVCASEPISKSLEWSSVRLVVRIMYKNMQEYAL